MPNFSTPRSRYADVFLFPNNPIDHYALFFSVSLTLEEIKRGQDA